jgi:ribonuclease BN (tRNA processing enzyme)
VSKSHRTPAFNRLQQVTKCVLKYLRKSCARRDQPGSSCSEPERRDPIRTGPATAIVVNETPYLVDFGSGVIRRAAAAYRNGVSAFGADVTNIKTAFLTHLHSDHSMGYPDLIFTPWLRGREQLDVYGPTGLQAMTTNIFKAWEVDLHVRTSVGPYTRSACVVNIHEIEPGLIYSDGNVTVTAFPVHHGEVLVSFGYRFETRDRTIVVSGDTTPVQSLIDHCSNCDVLIHEAYSMETYRHDPPSFQVFRQGHHTSSIELAEIANRVKPGLLVTYHHSTRNGGPVRSNTAKMLIDEIRQIYKGNVVVGHDLDVF